MRVPFAANRFCEDALNEALEGLRATLRGSIPVTHKINPFARAMPCPMGDMTRTAKVLRIF